ncbi:hypothetical protein PPL_03751 [Heterostelium album PN500]|uniref:Ankyrin repeat-containing protein n=1 Tax=Heterostelium pallidum (strain ATCC 26659 / Pp 5 / PN500) TaxID=670386 RepID=D3B6K3_HETP5|nr:hypothetical protein PPL_03751 [Heterostelium album PN500]EFA82973.1 hypothetical protein PPL_03751 [Heterostelium album PN500]|eukprot:XP_020435090.1 hypothetical protein PPL_03751 [Heterostelium album PN500]
MDIKKLFFNVIKINHLAQLIFHSPINDSDATYQEKVLSLSKFKYHHWTDPKDMIDHGYVSLLVDKIEQKNIILQTFQNRLPYICLKITDLETFKTIYNQTKIQFTSYKDQHDLIMNIVQAGNVEILKLFLGNSVFDPLNGYKYMWLAISYGHTSIVHYLSTVKGVEINFRMIHIHYESREISVSYIMNLWVNDADNHYCRMLETFKANDQSHFLEKLHHEINSPYWCDFLILGDPSLYRPGKYGDIGDRNNIKLPLIVRHPINIRIQLLATVLLYEESDYFTDINTRISNVIERTKTKYPHLPETFGRDNNIEHLYYIYLALLFDCRHRFEQCIDFTNVIPKLIERELALASNEPSAIQQTLNNLFTYLNNDRSFAYSKYILYKKSEANFILVTAIGEVRKLYPRILAHMMNDRNFDAAIAVQFVSWYKKLDGFVQINIELECATVKSLEFVLTNHSHLDEVYGSFTISTKSLRHLLNIPFNWLIERIDHQFLQRVLFPRLFQSAEFVGNLSHFAIRLFSSLPLVGMVDVGSFGFSHHHFCHLEALANNMNGSFGTNLNSLDLALSGSIEIYRHLKNCENDNFKKISLPTNWESETLKAIGQYKALATHKELYEALTANPNNNLINHEPQNIDMDPHAAAGALPPDPSEFTQLDQ